MLRDEIPTSDELVYIGQTLFRKPTFARLEPFAVAGSRGWTPISNPKIEFPENGLVFSTDPLVVDRDRGYLVLFTVAPNERPRRGDEWDHLLTEKVCFPYQVLRGFESLTPDEQREKLFSGGSDVADVQSPYVILPLGEDTYLRPRLTLSGDKWLASSDEDPSKLIVYKAGGITAIDGHFSFDGRYYALPGKQPAQKHKRLNYETDLEFFERLVKFLQKTGDIQADTHLNQISKALIRHLNTAYSQARIFNADPAENDAIRDRLQPFLQKLGNGIANVEAIAEALMNHPKIAAAIDAKIDQMRDDERDRIEQEIWEAEYKELEDEFKDTRNRLESLQSDNTKLEEDVAAKKAELDRLDELKILSIADAQASFDGFLQRVKDGAATINDLVSSAKTFGLRLPGSEPEPRLKAEQANEPPWTMPTTAEGDDISLDELPAVLEAAAAKCGLPVDLVRHLDIAARGGDVPIVAGPAAEILLSAYASSTTGGTIYRLPVDPTFLGVDDLWTHPTRKAETSLATAWRMATKDPDRLHLVVIHALKEAELTDWLVAFATTFRRSRPPNLCVVATKTTPRAKKDEERGEREIVIDTDVANNAAAAVLTRLGMPALRTTRLLGGVTQPLTSDEQILLQGLAGDRLKAEPDQALRLVALSGAAKAWVGRIAAPYSLPFKLLGFENQPDLNGA